MPRFVQSVEIAAPIEDVWDFHVNPANIMRVAPPASHFMLLSCSSDQLAVGTRIAVRSVQAGIPVRMEAEVTAIEPPYVMQDRQIHGPFRKWLHTHRFEKTEKGTRLIDEIEYSLPLGPVGALMTGVVARELKETFTYRQEETRRLLENGEVKG